ncbi:Dabb family protein [Bacillus sp. FJAT-45350]|uniref:Dabb family protein n=1 Tax=Bacillus sp. FJAT-45350 TaxID=2011014 RepID=UPI000BB94E66|nr:Dabb family protein [Bacillus sp. FJAT-45350]
MVEHMVLFRFDSNTSSEEKEKLIEKTYGFKLKIPGIVDIQAGLNFSHRFQRYDYWSYSTFFKTRIVRENYNYKSILPRITILCKGNWGCSCCHC